MSDVLMPPSMRIAYVCADRGVPVIGRSGSATHIREFVHALIRRKVEVQVLAACPSDGSSRATAPCPIIDLSRDAVLTDLRVRATKALRAGGQDGTRAGETYSLLLNQTLLEELTRLRGRVDLVYERQSLWSFAGLQFAQREGLPFFLEVNAPLALQQETYRKLDMAETAAAIEELLFASADRVLVTSAALREYARARGASARNIRVLPCGVSGETFSVARDRRLAGRSEFVVGFVGSLKPWHGVEILLKAFRRLSRLSSRYRLLIVGDGPLMPQVEAFCRAHNLSDVVMLAGAVDHDRIPGYLAQIDVGVAPYPPLPSFYFSPLKIWEYAAAAVPMVASASGELPQLFPHKVAALLHPPGSVRKIVKQVELLRHNRGLGERLARRARRVAKLHTWDRLAARFETMARRVLAGRDRRDRT